MPTPQNTTTATRPSRINSAVISMSPVDSVDTVMVDGAFTCHYATCLPLHAVFAAEARIEPMSKHPLPRQGTPRHRWRVALLGLSLPLALVSTSQVTSAPSSELP